ncbi:MAG: 6-pyruvoyl-tetrahydropterin synthase-related protein, partial [Eubacteriales bacterium]|nr:6-pyruvoyl-tetrahydropterin synthase-related protein [Eubacteriales bacterium]
PPEFGLITDYEGIAIGAFADTVPLYFPSFSVGVSDALDDYRIEDFEGYETVFLSGFSFRDQEAAEDLVRTLADRGIKVVIDVTHVPFDPVTQRMNFLGVNVSGISFVNHFPDMYYGDAKVLAGPFSEEYTTWNTQYLVQLDHIMGYTDYSGERLIWAGYNDDPNIVFLGFNLVFHAIDAEDMEIFQLLSSIMEVPYRKLPHRELVPLDIEHSDNGMRIRSDYSGVNTTLAWQDIFESSSELGNENNLMVVRQGVTDIRFVYPLGKPGLKMSLAGLLASLMILFNEDFLRRRSRKKASDPGNSGSDLPQNKV